MHPTAAVHHRVTDTPMGPPPTPAPAQPAERQTYSPGGPDSPAQPGAGDSDTGTTTPIPVDDHEIPGCGPVTIT
jgi:hypothetical protein